MLRFIIKCSKSLTGRDAHERHYTVDADCPALQHAISQGGFGNSMHEDAYEIHTLVAVEELDPPTI